MVGKRKLTDAQRAENKKIANKKWKDNNKDKIIKWRKKNRKEINEYCKNYNKNYVKPASMILARENKKIEFRNMISKIKSLYKCMNPNCFYHNNTIDECCLDFHHLKEKKYNVAAMIYRNKFSVLNEIAKCIILCSNCHRKVTYKKLDISKIKCCEVRVMEKL